MNKLDHKKFSFAEAFSDLNGKTSISAIAGGHVILTGTVSFLLAVGASFFIKDIGDSINNILIQSTLIIATGASLLLAKRLKPTVDNTLTEE